jgi:hypothetical protein
MTNVIQTLVGCHANGTHTLITMDAEDTRRMTNELTLIVLENTPLTEQAAQRKAEDMLGLAEAPTKERKQRIVFQSKDAPPLPAATLVSATLEQQKARKEHIDALQEERKWCTLCTPPRKYGNLLQHRQKVHNLPGLPPLKVI